MRPQILRLFVGHSRTIKMGTNVDLTDMRKSYDLMADKRCNLNQLTIFDPILLFDFWFKIVESRANVTFEEVNAVALSTATKDGRPSSRMVLLKGYGNDGFRFFTNYNSRKGRELLENPYAAILAYWPWLSRSVRIEGEVKKLPPEDGDDYWKKRPIGSQASAAISHQSSVVGSREELEHRVATIMTECKDKEIARPEHWGGFILKPTTIEFWQGHDNRLHDRIRFRKPSPSEVIKPDVTHKGDDGWVYERLEP